jgi:hypothetical protein
LKPNKRHQPGKPDNPLKILQIYRKKLDKSRFIVY